MSVSLHVSSCAKRDAGARVEKRVATSSTSFAPCLPPRALVDVPLVAAVELDVVVSAVVVSVVVEGASAADGSVGGAGWGPFVAQPVRTSADQAAATARRVG